nr:hydroxyproline O-galactosyltransferase GALT2-like [Ipomoea trifida]GMD20928.1 hydroxyproline O-galactosyltransferase GALT2 [Ipomoea batatas]GMD25359.1 hydroxyproline O-galactosyltransferase GALT2 [Ipomoea batatas]GMD25404.1 hydroxyproline O-galactosyltransferase GALT2 [Ipomoea batatas]GME16940.1 hydroxyproline O-galactosyltransferase GALT2 [Ipomoea batatas]
MKRLKNEVPGMRRFKLSHILLGLAVFYLILICLKLPDYLESAQALSSDHGEMSVDAFISVEEEGGELNKRHLGSVYTDDYHRILQNNANHRAPKTPWEEALPEKSSDSPPVEPHRLSYGRIASAILKQRIMARNISVLDRMVDEAWTLGLKAWEEADEYNEKEMVMNSIIEGKPESCPSSVTANQEELAKRDSVMLLPCGLAAGSSVTVIGTPRYAHHEYVPQLARRRTDDGLVLVSQFMFELQGLKSVVGEDPPKILHLNPRLRGDWSHRPVIEHNTCYRMQWGRAHRCDGMPSKSDDDMLVDGYLRCEKWMRNDIVDSKESKIFSWFDRFIGRAKKPEVTWPFPFVEGKMFILTVRAGIDGFHISVGGRHLSSFPYRTGFTLEDATGLAVRGDVEVHSVFATSLPTSHPSFSPQRVLDFSEKWKSHPLPQNPIQVFIGTLSATNHFAERMAIRKTWMQSQAIKSSDVVVRFFVALNPRKELNAILKKEAAYFGDIVILPFIDRYELVVLKTIAICEYGVRNVTASYIMKCDDDNFVRLDAVLQEINHVPPGKPLYMGNLNLLHRPLRNGKWAVTLEEWPEDIYPPYANGPGYIISNDIAKYIVSQHHNHSLRLFKMEDVSMGMWVEKYNSSTPVQYSHNWKFCQYGCTENYFTAHYQSPRQMECLWDNLLKGRVRCCNI